MCVCVCACVCVCVCERERERERTRPRKGKTVLLFCAGRAGASAWNTSTASSAGRPPAVMVRHTSIRPPAAAADALVALATVAELGGGGSGVRRGAGEGEGKGPTAGPRFETAIKNETVKMGQTKVVKRKRSNEMVKLADRKRSNESDQKEWSNLVKRKRYNESGRAKVAKRRGDTGTMYGGATAVDRTSPPPVDGRRGSGQRTARRRRNGGEGAAQRQRERYRTAARITAERAAAWRRGNGQTAEWSSGKGPTAAGQRPNGARPNDGEKTVVKTRVKRR